MANNLSFSFDNNPINVILMDGEPWFYAKEVCNALSIKNSRHALTALDDDERGVALTDTLGGKQHVAIVSESGVYTLALRCRDAIKKGTKPYNFRKLVTKEILPAVRKTGSYTHTINAEQQYQIKEAVNNYTYRTGQHHQTVYKRLYNEFKIPKYQDLPASQFDEAMQFLGCSGKLALDHEIKDRTLVAIEQVCLHFRIIHGWWKQYEPAIRQLNPNIAGSLEDSFQQGHVFSHDLERMFNLGLKPLNYYSWYPFGQDREARRLYEMDTPSPKGGRLLCDLSQ